MTTIIRSLCRHQSSHAFYFTILPSLSLWSLKNSFIAWLLTIYCQNQLQWIEETTEKNETILMTIIRPPNDFVKSKRKWIINFKFIDGWLERGSTTYAYGSRYRSPSTPICRTSRPAGVVSSCRMEDESTTKAKQICFSLNEVMTGTEL